MTAPDLDFQLYSEHSRTRHELRFRDLLEELHDELLRRRDFYPKLVARDAMRQGEADDQIRLLAATIVDFRHYDLDDEDRPQRDHYEPYFAKVNCLRREILMRRNRAKKQPASSVHSLAESRRHLERLEAVHDWYWNGPGLDCIGDYAAFADEADRRNLWMATHPWPLGRSELEVRVTVYGRLAYPRPDSASAAAWGDVRRRFRHHGPAPFTVADTGDRPSCNTVEILNADGELGLWSPDDWRSLDRALHGPRCFDLAAPVTSNRDTLEVIAIALNEAAERHAAEPEILAAE